jgi:N-acetyltransferase
MVRSHHQREPQRALERLGARAEGILRQYMSSPRSGPRDVAVYRILASEWDEVRASLEPRLR